MTQIAWLAAAATTAVVSPLVLFFAIRAPAEQALYPSVHAKKNGLGIGDRPNSTKGGIRVDW